MLANERYTDANIIVMSKPLEIILFIHIRREEKGLRRRIGRTLVRNSISQVHRGDRYVLLGDMGQRSEKDAVTPFFASSAIVGPIFELRNLISIRDWTTCDL